MNIHLTDQEADELVKYLDQDGSGDIDFKEFQSKINFKDLQMKNNLYTITKVSFIECILKLLEHQRQKERIKIMEIFHKFDDNNDGVLTFDEFEQLLRSLSGKLQKK